MTRKKVILISFPFIVLIGLYFLGPEPETPAYSTTMPAAPSEPGALETFVRLQDEHHKIKPENETQIVWVDSTRTKTEYAVVYLHGFSASQMEGDPIHRRFAKTFGCNLYLPRLADHGVDTTEQLLLFTADRVWESAKHALAVGKQLGNKVILLSTSTGGSLALMLAAQYPDDVYALINMSPNIAINNPAAFLLNNPWGLQIARMVKGGEYNDKQQSAEHAKYWNGKYRLESAVQLQELLEDNMTNETFSKVTQPSLTVYYYKSEEAQDPEVKVSAMLEMNKALGTPESLKEAIAIPGAEAHVIGSSLVSHDVDGVYNVIEKFAIEKLKMTKKN